MGIARATGASAAAVPPVVSPAVPPVPRVPPVPSDFVNIGCFQDTDTLRVGGPLAGQPRAMSMIYARNGRVVPWSLVAPNSSKMVNSIDEAKDIAIANNNSVFGIQANGFLFLGNSIDNATKYGRVLSCVKDGAGVNQSAWANDVWALR